MWRCYLCDTVTGLIRAEIEVPSFSWSISVSDCSFDSTADKGTGEGESSGITIPWAAIPASTPEERGEYLSTGRRALCLCWEDEDDGSIMPIIFGAIGERTDTYLDTSFSLDSPMTLLGERYAVEEDAFGTGTYVDEGEEDDDTDDETIYYVTTSSIYLSGLSFRAIAAYIGTLCTESKPGGTLPIDWQYTGESGSHERTYYGYNVSNISCSDIFTKLANVSGGPDMQFRPYMYDSTHVRLLFEAASDSDVYLGDSVHYLHDYNNLTVEHSAPYHRVYQTGAGSEQAMLCYLAEDLTYCELDDDPFPLKETTSSDTSDDSIDEVVSAATAKLESVRYPLCQVTLETDVSEVDIGNVWPGEQFMVPIYDFPTLPDGEYTMRLMEMSGSEGTSISMTFDVMEDPTY